MHLHFKKSCNITNLTKLQGFPMLVRSLALKKRSVDTTDSRAEVARAASPSRRSNFSSRSNSPVSALAPAPHSAVNQSITRRASPSSIAGIARATNQLQKTDLRPGDILVLMQDDKKSIDRSLIIGAQKLVKKMRRRENASGDPEALHTAMWVKAQDNNSVRSSPSDIHGEPEIVEAHKNPLKPSKTFMLGTALRDRTYQVFRCDDANTADWAAQTSMAWSHRNIPYARKKATLSPLKTIKTGIQQTQDSKTDIERFKANAFETDGTWAAKDGLFCSEHIVGAYQAASSRISEAIQDDDLDISLDVMLGENDEIDNEEQSTRHASTEVVVRGEPIPSRHKNFSIDLRADRTTPMSLHHFLLNNPQFKLTGQIQASENEVLEGYRDNV
jgi:hypothetical protein